MVGDQGIEPRMPEAPDLQSGVVTNATRHPNYFYFTYKTIIAPNSQANSSILSFASFRSFLLSL